MEQFPAVIVVVGEFHAVGERPFHGGVGAGSVGPIVQFRVVDEIGIAGGFQKGDVDRGDGQLRLHEVAGGKRGILDGAAPIEHEGGHLPGGVSARFGQGEHGDLVHGPVSIPILDDQLGTDDPGCRGVDVDDQLVGRGLVEGRGQRLGIEDAVGGHGRVADLAEEQVLVDATIVVEGLGRGGHLLCEGHFLGDADGPRFGFLIGLDLVQIGPSIDLK